jgi:glutamate synthase domain-containing protein 1
MDFKDYIKNLNNELKNINQENIFKDPREKYISDYRVPSGCAIFGIINENGDLFDGSMVIDGIEMMHDRSNGLGGGFAAYGIYPEYKDNYAFHIFYNDSLARKESEILLQKAFKIMYGDEIPTRKVASVANPPIIARYFLSPKNIFIEIEGIEKENEFADEIINRNEEEFVANFVSNFNADSCNAYIISSGKNMGIFKGVGYPEDIGEFYKLNEYKAYIWTAHGRFPTNSTGWWGGAHPFGFLNWSVVHNGEISSYGTNKRFVSGFGYKCSFSTDTEVLAYLFDLLVRKHGISLYLINYILAAPLWKDIEILPEDIKEFLTALRIVYAKALVNGPFSIIVGNNNFMYALNDRIKLRPLVAAKKGQLTFVSSEESAIRKVCHDPGTIWNPKGGEPVIVYIKGKEPKSQPSVKISRENFLENVSGFDNSFAGILK